MGIRDAGLVAANRSFAVVVAAVVPTKKIFLIFFSNNLFEPVFDELSLLECVVFVVPLDLFVQLIVNSPSCSYNQQFACRHDTKRQRANPH